MSVPRPGPSSTMRTVFLPFCLPSTFALAMCAIHWLTNHTPTSYRTCVLITPVQNTSSGERTSPNTWLISGLVMKSPLAPKTG